MTARDPETILTPPLGGKIMDAAIWNTFQLIAARGAALLVQLILARILLPEHFGIVGMAAVFIDIIGAVGDLGLAAALIQYKKEKLTQEHLNTAFWASLGFNGLIFLFFALVVGPFAAWFYGEPLLQVIVPIAGAENLLRSFGLIQRVILTRELRFKPIGIVEASSSILSGIIAIGAALAGAGVWSLVIKDLGFVGISLPLLWLTVKWRPRFSFSRTALNDILGAGIYDALQRLFLFTMKNIDYLLVGKFLGAELLGIYTLAFVLADSFRLQVWAILNKVMFPIYSQVQDDLSRVKDYYLKIIKYNTMAVTPIMLTFIFFAEPLIRTFFGEKWLLAIFPLQVMAFSAFVVTLSGTAVAVLKGLGKFDVSFRLTILNALLISIPAFTIGIYFFGINGAAFAVLVHQTSSQILLQLQMRKLVGVTEKEIVEAVKIPIYGALASMPFIALAHYLFQDLDLLALLASVSGVALAYGLTVFLLNKTEFIWLYQMISRRTRNLPT